MKQKAIFPAIMAAICYSISAPIAKLLLQEISPVFLAALLYLGAGIGMTGVKALKRNKQKEANLTKADTPYVIAMIVLDIAAPIFLMMGLLRTTAATVALIGNFEIVVTALIALFVFKEAIGARMWLAIILITIACGILSIADYGNITITGGIIYILLACTCWGLENNCTKMLSLSDPLQIVIIKGWGSGLGSLGLAFWLREVSINMSYVLAALAVGFVAYGLSIYFYIHAQRRIGAARTSAYYAFAPFIGTAISFAVFREQMRIEFVLGLLVMMVGSYFAVSENHQHYHQHEFADHNHRHSHSDGHHTHYHAKDEVDATKEHSHQHVHQQGEHSHQHLPDMHHNHSH